MPAKDFLKIQMKGQIKLLSQLRVNKKFNVTLTSYLVGYEKYNFDEQGDWKDNTFLDSTLDFQSQFSLEELSPTSKTYVPSLSLNLEITPSTQQILYRSQMEA